jgi:transcriptional regulator with XRE-family HTH domain
MNTGRKIRGVRIFKGFSQENMADMLGMTVLKYGNIERGTKVTVEELEQIAEKLGVPATEILRFEDTTSNFFEQCSQTNVVTGQNGNQTYYNDHRETQHQLEKVQLELKNSHLENDNLRLKLEKAELELKYWKEKQ